MTIGTAATTPHPSRSMPAPPTVPPDLGMSFSPCLFFPYEERPLDLPLDVEECATAIYLKNGDLDAARRD